MLPGSGNAAMRTLQAALLLGFALPGAPAHALDLLQAYRLAMGGGDPTYLAARATAEAAREAVPQARAGLLPQITANASRSRNNTDQTTQVPGAASITRQFDYAAKATSLNLRQPLVRLANVAGYQSAQAQVEAAEATLEQEAQSLVLRVAGAYFDLMVGREKLDSVIVQKEAYAAQLAAAERAFAAGFGTRTDIDDARARHDIAGAQEIEARQDLRVGERTLSAMLNQRVAAGELLGIRRTGFRPPAPAPQELDGWVSRAQERNPELRTLRATVAAAEKEVDKGRAAHLPTLDLVASLSNNDSDSNTTIGNRYVTSSLGVQLAVPLYLGGQVDSGVRQARAALEKVRQQYEAGRRQVETEVTKQFGAVEQGVAKVRALEQAERSAEQSVISTRRGMEAGVRNSVDVLNALQQLAAARLELIKARYTFAMDWLKLRSAAGELGEADVEGVNAWLGPGERPAAGPVVMAPPPAAPVGEVAPIASAAPAAELAQIEHIAQVAKVAGPLTPPVAAFSPPAAHMEFLEGGATRPVALRLIRLMK